MGRTPNYDFTTLPKWTQDKINAMQAYIEELEAQVEEQEGIIATLVKLPIDDTVTVVYGGTHEETTADDDRGYSYPDEYCL